MQIERVEEMPGLIGELKREVLDENVPVSALLRKALVVAKEQDDEESERWIESELKGYADDAEVPAYREVTGRPILRDHYTGWQYIYTHNLIPELEHKISSFVYRTPIAVFESNAKEDNVATTYHPRAERMLIKALGGRVGIPAILFTGQQFQDALDVVRNKLIDWVNGLEEPEADDRPAEGIQPAEPQLAYEPTGLGGFVRENRSWLFQGVGTELIKALVVLVLMLGSFLFGRYWQDKNLPSPKPSREEINKRIDLLTQGHNTRKQALTEAIIQQQRDASISYSNQYERQKAIEDLHKDLNREDETYQNDLKALQSLAEK
jgi:hypothetical protein